ncbi:pirin-like C-terminal cupin domain-containing protein [Methylomicrobium lacus]|uniref:pirin-like C-terminal cupin domain-containing protein n=1 Tax=Methylomicrobium lacus TaxID=136992 RepID=UPI0035A8DB9C
MFLDVRLPGGGHFVHPIAQGHNALVYIYEGQAEIGPMAERHPLEAHAAGVLSDGDRVEVHAGQEEAAFLVLVAGPLREPIVQYGPFAVVTK